MRLEESAFVMGANFTIVLYGYDQSGMRRSIDAAFLEARRLDAMLSIYRPASELCEVNRSAARRGVRISRELFRLLSDCLEYSRRSDGSFDVSVGSLVKAWGFHEGTGDRPSATRVEAARVKVGYQYILLDAEAHTVRFDKPGLEINLGGIGKGYAVDRMVDVLKRCGSDSALVAASGSSIYGLGSPPSFPAGWPVDIRHPETPLKVVGTIYLRDLSMSTSGGCDKYILAGGRKYTHILDPRTGCPVQSAGSVSVTAPRTQDSEAWTKPCFINGRLWAARHKPDNCRVFFCEDGRDPSCIWL